MSAGAPSRRSPLRGLLAAAAGAARALFETVLPQTCATCGAASLGSAGVQCEACRFALARLMRLSSCPRCGRFRPSASIHPEHCAGCRSEAFWNVAAVACAAPYVDPVQRAVKRLKFGGDARCAGLLGAWAAEAIAAQRWKDKIDVLVPVPMHYFRRLQRPCDHALELAKEMSLRLRIPVQRAAVRRVKYAPSQTRAISRHGRFEQVKGCFEAARRAKVRGRTVCIVDNIVVSGATIHEVSRVLRAAGAKRIYCAAAARAVLPGETQLGLEHADAVAEEAAFLGGAASP